MAAGVARAELAGHRDDDGDRHRRAVAGAAEEDAGLAAVYGRAAAGAGVCGVGPGRGEAGAQAEGAAELHGDVYGGAEVRAADVRDDRERVDEEAGGAVHGEPGLSDVSREAVEAGGAVDHVRGDGHHGDVAAAAEEAGADL